jgi:hypothetical protein
MKEAANGGGLGSKLGMPIAAIDILHMYCWAVYNRSEQKDSSHHILAHTQNLRRHMLI